MAVIGIGGKGKSLVTQAANENLGALCDVDWNVTVEEVFNTYKQAKRYKDYRLMLDRQKEIDAVMIATPDHTHAVISMEAIKRNKHVYTEKPLTCTILESRKLTEAARKYKVRTQMGNQHQADESSRRLREMIWDGVIGDVHEVHIWTDRPNRKFLGTYWPQGISRPKDILPIPESLDWDLFIGPAPKRPYHSAYHPFNWRGWLDFGTGALGDIGCHRFDPVFRALKLKYPTSVEAASTIINDETYPQGSVVYYKFPAREDMPPLTLIWYDGGLRPPVLSELENGDTMGYGGTLFIGSKGKILGNKIYPKKLREEYTPPEPSIPSSPGHFEEWVNACKGGESAGSNFEWAGPLTETVLLGNIALQPELKEGISSTPLQFDSEKFCFPNFPEADKFLHYTYREGWHL